MIVRIIVWEDRKRRPDRYDCSREEADAMPFSSDLALLDAAADVFGRASIPGVGARRVPYPFDGITIDVIYSLHGKRYGTIRKNGDIRTTYV